jgi:hypothetical protein
MDYHHVRGNRDFGRVDGFFDAVSGLLHTTFAITAFDKTSSDARSGATISIAHTFPNYANQVYVMGEF